MSEESQVQQCERRDDTFKRLMREGGMRHVRDLRMRD